jgi:hypothetical protein
MKQEKNPRAKVTRMTFKHRGMQVPIDRNSYQDRDLVFLTAQPRAMVQWDDPVLRQQIR